MSATTVYARRFVSLVKFEHTVFALPFAYVGMILAVGGAPSFSLLFWITLAMVGARSLAMALNRLIDHEIDARNPRTAGRELPRGLLSPGQVAVFAVAALVVFLIAVWQLDPIVRWLWPIPVALFVVYPYTKRFTWMCHFVLGASIGLSPLAAWLAAGSAFALAPVLISIAVALWVGGFDVLYGTADIEIDRAQGLESIPCRFGVARALTVTRIAHLAAIALLAWAGISLDLGPIYFLDLAVVAALLGYENAIVHPDDLSRLNTAFFTLNGVISVVFLVGVVADVIL